MIKEITKDITYVGCDDKTLDLFESQYIIPNGIAYNAYVIMDENIALIDTVDKRKTDEWLENVEKVLDGKTPKYLVVNHMEPDHSGSVEACIKKYPEITLVGNKKTFLFLKQFTGLDLEATSKVVAEGDTLDMVANVFKKSKANVLAENETIYLLPDQLLVSKKNNK